MANVVVVGSQWGDEGKGKVVDILSTFADATVRFQGGNNAGHTLVVDGKKTILHLVPSGVLHKGKTCVIGSGLVVDAEVLWSEIQLLRQHGYLKNTDRLRLSYDASVIMPYHRKLDALREKGLKIGTTGRGIGPCYEDRAARRGLRMRDLLDAEILEKKIRFALEYHNFVIEKYYGETPMEVDEILPKALESGNLLRPYMDDTALYVDNFIHQGRQILFEGAQGTMLDIDHGTYPFVTSSNTLAGAACCGLGIGPGKINDVVGVTKAYTTRVGECPFPTELNDETGEMLQAEGKEFGATTGRPRRCGWLDAVVLRRAVRLNGFTGLAVTKLDVLSNLEKIKICVGYQRGNERFEEFPCFPEVLTDCEPIYEEHDGWMEDISEIRTWEDLPNKVKTYLRRIEELADTPIVLISLGPQRGSTIILSNPFRPEN